jgi:hypothetical protein
MRRIAQPGLRLLRVRNSYRKPVIPLMALVP